jgi:putative sigma-54 modulation protein
MALDQTHSLARAVLMIFRNWLFPVGTQPTKRGHAMRIDVRGRRIKLGRRLREYAERAVTYALGRHEQRLGLVTVLITDINGPRKGVDRQCTLLLNPRGRGSIVVRRTETTAWAAIDRAVECARQVLRSVQDKMRCERRGRAAENISYGKTDLNQIDDC